ncbi:MAG: 50S ribosomal protein L25/general stress protein Ctc [Hyphomicrobiaceae bacterium]
MATNELIATARPRAGKGAARAVRRENKVPAVIYGNKTTPETISLEFNELLKMLTRGRFLSQVVTLKIDGRTERVLPRDVQLDPVKDLPVHVDFQRIALDGRVRVYVPVSFINEAASPGLKRGGVLNIVRHEVELLCPADHIPEQIVVDLTGVEIGHSIHISHVNLPADVTPTITNRDFTVATVAGSAAAKGEEAAAEAAATTTAAPAGGATAKAAPAAAGKAAAGSKAAPAASKAAPKK